MVTIHPTEERQIEARGGVVRNGLLEPRPGSRGCPFKTAEGLCRLHGTPDKPLGCIVSPFTLNRNGTLVVRNRYKLLPCYRGNGPKEPAYRVFRSSLLAILDPERVAQIEQHLDAGGGDLIVPMRREIFRRLVENDAIKRANKAAA
jgi:hypothetical protein